MLKPRQVSGKHAQIHNTKSQQVQLTAPVQLNTPMNHSSKDPKLVLIWTDSFAGTSRTQAWRTRNEPALMWFVHTHTLSSLPGLEITLSLPTCQNRWVRSKAQTLRPHFHRRISPPPCTDPPLLSGDDEDIIEEEEVDLMPQCPLEEDAAVFHECSQLSSLYHPPGGWDQRERLGKE